MKIDGNELAILQNDLDREGKKEEALRSSWNFCVRCANPVITARARRRAAITATASSA